MQLVLPNFTALPVPEFNLLWKDRIDRTYPKNEQGTTKQIYIYIEIDVYWHDRENNEQHFCTQMRYQSPQAVYAIPVGGWANLNELLKSEEFPRVVYVPPFSGIEPHESWMDDGNVKQHVGKSQPGSVLRNLLYRVIDNDTALGDNKGWTEITSKIKEWFNVELQVPQYTKGISTEIKVEYKANGKLYDIISGGSGFHQILTLLAFLYGYKGVSTILLDEPDAHLHSNLQRKVVNYFMSQDMQFLIATHSEEFIKAVDIHSIISIMSGEPKRIDSTDKIIKALSEVDNGDVVRTQESPYIIYVEGEDDDRILSAWAKILGKENLYQKYYPYTLGGTTKKLMKERSDEHYTALKQIVPNLKRVLLLDYDAETTFHPDLSNPSYKEWKRKNIDNYLLVPDAWKKAIRIQLNEPEDSLFLPQYNEIVDDFFAEQNLTLPLKSTWRNVKANVFEIVDGKKILFENKDSLFNRILTHSQGYLKISRPIVAMSMSYDELHQDIIDLFASLEDIAK